METLNNIAQIIMFVLLSFLPALVVFYIRHKKDIDKMIEELKNE